MFNNILAFKDNFYFIGIGGVSMSALALILNKMGKTVAGSDITSNEYTARLQSAGIRVDSQDNLSVIENYDAVVYTDAVKDTNKQLCEAVRLHKAVISRGALLGELCELFRKTIGVSGCHGKTTCTSMISHIFSQAELSFSCHIGGNDLQLLNCSFRGYDYFVTEACEYNKNLLWIHPDVAVVLNSDTDHLECYASEEDLQQTYIAFADRASVAIGLYGDLSVAGATTFGFDDRADYYAKGIKNVNGKYSFNVYEGDCKLGTVKLDVYGKHNVLNALAAIAVARSVGLPFETISRGLTDFKGVQRRFERVGAVNGAEVIADYAHHPNEIKATLRTARLVTQGELYVIFQPHTYSRTKNLFKQFVAVLSPLKNLLIYRTFAAREYYDDAGSALTLSAALKKSRYADSVRDIERFIGKAKKGDTVLVLGAGDIYYLIKETLES